MRRGTVSSLNNANVRDDVSLLMRRIEDEVARRRARSDAPKPIVTQGSFHSTANNRVDVLPAPELAIIPADPVRLNLACSYARARPAKTSFALGTNASYHVRDFSPYEGIEFIDTAYQTVLHREADEDGMQTYSRMLREGASKSEILAQLRDSPEGKRREARVDGLSSRILLDALCQWPVVGKVIAIAAAICNLPNAQRSHRRISSGMEMRLTQTDRGLAELHRTVYRSLEILEKSQNALSELTRNWATRSGLDAVRHSISTTAAALDSKPDRGDLENLAVELRASAEAMDKVKANADNVAALRTRIADLGDSVSALDIAKANSKDLQLIRAESSANLAAGYGRAVLQIDGLARSLEATKKNSLAALEGAHVRWTELLGQIASVKADQAALQTAQKEGDANLKVEMDRAVEPINTMVQVKAHQESLEVMQRASKDAIGQVRNQMLQALESKAERQETTALSNHLVGLLRQQPSQEEFKRIAAALAKTEDAIAAVAANQDADQVGVDAVKFELSGAIELMRIQMLQSLESKAERKDTVELSNHLMRQLRQQPTKEELGRVIASLAKTDGAIAGVRQTKADKDELALLRSAIEKETRGAVEEMQASTKSKADQCAIAELGNKLEAAFGEMTESTDAVRREVLEEIRRAMELLGQQKTDKTTTDAMRVEAKTVFQQIEAQVKDSLAPVITQNRDLKRNVLEQERRLTLLLDEARKRFPAPISTGQLGAMLLEEDHHLDAMYASFEDQFRGTRSDILQRQAIYLPFVREAKAGTREAPVVDLGCGRGEWLELLSSEGLCGQGVDRNRVFLAGCRERNLDVTEQDALAFLRQCKPNSMGVVTAFHVIEHMPNKELISLIDEAFRVLRPGGLVIFETPNPRNLIVAACNFYLDPTHRHPLPPELSRYLLEARGFGAVDILEMHPFEPEFQITEGATPLKDALNQYLFSAQDYAVIGRKAE